MFSKKIIIETINIAPFTMHKEIDQFILTHELEDAGIPGRSSSIQERKNSMTRYVINETTDKKIKESVILDLINQELKNLQWDEKFSVDTKSFQEKYPRLYDALREAGFNIEGYRLVRDGLIDSPDFTYTFGFVVECLDQCQTLIREHSFGSAMDRAHTALHGYLKMICREFELEMTETNPNLQYCWSMIKNYHPKFNSDPKEYDSLFNQVINAIAKIMDKMNIARDNKSYVHPNDEILGEEESKLMINLSRAFLQYIDGKLSGD